MAGKEYLKTDQYILLRKLYKNHKFFFKGMKSRKYFMKEWLPFNLPTYNAFKDEIYSLVEQRGYASGPEAVVNIRADRNVQVGDSTSGYKVDARATPFMSRLVMLEDPSLLDKIEIRFKSVGGDGTKHPKEVWRKKSNGN